MVEGGQAIKLDLRESSGKKRRILISLSWDDAKLASPARIRDLQWSAPAWLPSILRAAFDGTIKIIRHFFVWIQEIFTAPAYSARTYYRQSKSSKKADQPGHDQFSQRDLDLLCFIYDADKNFVRKITPDPDNQIDEARSVYHSGEEFTGAGVYDDETICIEDGVLPDTYRHFVFLTVSDSKLSLGECGTFNMRLSDSVSEKAFITTPITPEQSGGNTAYIFCHAWREGNDWYAKSIGSFADFESDWPTELKKFI
jgi:stress response protein SCP2